MATAERPRAVADLLLCAAVRHRLPGRTTIPELIATDKRPYYDALERMDASEKAGAVDLEPMRALVEGYLARQLADAFEAAGREPSSHDEPRKFH